MFVEYLWLAIAGLGIVAITNEVNRMDAAAAVHAKEQAVRVAYQEARMMALGGDMVVDGNQAQNLERSDRRASWYRYLVECLELGYENDRWSQFLAQNAHSGRVDHRFRSKPIGDSGMSITSERSDAGCGLLG